MTLAYCRIFFPRKENPFVTVRRLSREGARNTVMLTVSEQLRVNPARYSRTPAARGHQDPASRPLFGWWTDPSGAVSGAFLPAPPHPLLLTAVTARVAAGLAAGLAGGR